MAQNTVICHTPQEFEALTKAFAAQPMPPLGRIRFAESKLVRIFFASRPGIKACLESFELIQKNFPTANVIDFGAAGGLSPNLKVGDCVWADRVVNHQGETLMIERFEAFSFEGAIVGAIAGEQVNISAASDRACLFQSTRALLTCWEAFALGQAALEAGFSFFSFRVVSDVGAAPLKEEYFKNVVYALKKGASVFAAGIGSLSPPL